MQFKHLKNIIYYENTSLKDVLENLGQWAEYTENKGFGIIINNDGKCVGVITDGDVRRKMLEGFDLNDFVYRACKNRFIVLFESHFKRNYIHIWDIASVFLYAIQNYDSMKGGAYNVGLSDANLSKRELCDKIKEHLPGFQIFESEIAEDPDKRDYIVSNKKIEATGWAPKYSIDDGVKELIKTYSYLDVNPYNNV